MNILNASSVIFRGNRIPVSYWGDKKNFGDLLSPFVVEHLSGVTCDFVPVGKISAVLLHIIMELVRFKLPRKAYLKRLISPNPTSLFAIGSILEQGGKNSTYWGSGFMRYNSQFGGGEVLAVRGELSKAKLGVGYEDLAVGDPAILLPLIIPQSGAKRYSISIIPHWTEVDYFVERYGSDYHIIDFRSDDFGGIIDEITSSERVLSSSLHGVIISHAYNIPALWIKHGDIGTDGFKFADYFSSVGIESYDGVELSILDSKEIEQYQDRMVVSRETIEMIQRDLLRVAPFALQPKFDQL